MAIWVDDGLVASSSKQVILEIIQYLQLQFEIVSRSADLFVGLLIKRNREKKIYIFHSQIISTRSCLNSACRIVTQKQHQPILLADLLQTLPQLQIEAHCFLIKKPLGVCYTA